jgi:hypothetical protein
MILAGKREPSVSIATCLALALDVSLDWLCGLPRRNAAELAPDEETLLSAYRRSPEVVKEMLLNMAKSAPKDDE